MVYSSLDLKMAVHAHCTCSASRTYIYVINRCNL